MICRLLLTRLDTTPGLSISQQVEARESENGFDVYICAPLITEKAIKISNAGVPYTWKNFAIQLMGMQEGYIEPDDIDDTSIEGESGLRAYALKLAWAYHDSGSHLLDLLVFMTEQSIDRLEEHDNFDELHGLAELITEHSLEKYFESLLTSHQTSTVQDLFQVISEAANDKLAAREKKNLDKLRPFRDRIDSFSDRFSNEKKSIGPVFSGYRPSEKDIVEKWLQHYILEHGHFPSGVHSVKIPFIGGSTIGVGLVDFSN